MNPRALILCAATVAALCGAPAAAGAADQVYDVTFTGGGEYHHTWERVIDEDNAERRQTDLRFWWQTTYEGVTFRDGKLVAPVEDVIPEAGVTGTEVQHHRSPTGTSAVTCATPPEGADVGAGVFGHGLDLEGVQVVVRPAERLGAWLRCGSGDDETNVNYDMQWPSIGGEWPIMGSAPLDAVFELPGDAVGAGKIVQRVAGQPRDCPLRDPDHTLSCTIAWVGEVELVRTDHVKPSVRARVDRERRRVVLEVGCRAACRGVAELRVWGADGKRHTIARVPFTGRAGRTTRITRRFGPRTWRAVARAGHVSARVL